MTSSKEQSEVLEFDLGQGWAKSARVRFYTQEESAALDMKDGVALRQVHGKKLVDWSPSVGDYSATEADGFIATGDSFKTSRKKLYIRSADCCPLIYIDRKNEKVAALHAGWRGLAQQIHLVPFERGFDPATTWIWCGPSLNGEHFEVGEDMWSEFLKLNQKHIPNLSRVFSNEALNGMHPEKDKKFFFVWNYLEDLFRSLKVELFYNVEVNTFADEKFASHRRRKKSGDNERWQQNYSAIAFVDTNIELKKY